MKRSYFRPFAFLFAIGLFMLTLTACKNPDYAPHQPVSGVDGPLEQGHPSSR